MSRLLGSDRPAAAAAATSRSLVLCSYLSFCSHLQGRDKEKRYYSEDFNFSISLRQKSGNGLAFFIVTSDINKIDDGIFVIGVENL